MTVIKNVHPLTAEVLFDILKKEFPDYINTRLNAELNIDFAHVFDEITVKFPEVIAGTVIVVSVNTEEITVSDQADTSAFNIDLLKKNLIDFIELKAG